MNLFDAFYPASGLVFMAVGLALLATLRRHVAALALATFVLGLGVRYATVAIWDLSGTPATLQALLGLVAAAGLGAFAVLFPTRLTRSGWIEAAFSAAGGLAFVVIFGWINMRSESPIRLRSHDCFSAYRSSLFGSTRQAS